MTSRRIAEEKILPHWQDYPSTGWDHWIRLLDLGECIFPDVPRTHHIGNKKASTVVRADHKQRLANMAMLPDHLLVRFDLNPDLQMSGGSKDESWRANMAGKAVEVAVAAAKSAGQEVEKSHVIAAGGTTENAAAPSTPNTKGSQVAPPPRQAPADNRALSALRSFFHNDVSGESLTDEGGVFAGFSINRKADVAYDYSYLRSAFAYRAWESDLLSWVLVQEPKQKHQPDMPAPGSGPKSPIRFSESSAVSLAPDTHFILSEHLLLYHGINDHSITHGSATLEVDWPRMFITFKLPRYLEAASSKTQAISEALTATGGFLQILVYRRE
ncbi:unnamed protein product, partial [Amoebophrya sp. A25]|eukprot:GSA25T00023608001.1